MRKWVEFLEEKLEESSIFDGRGSVVISPDEFGGLTVNLYDKNKRKIILRTKNKEEATQKALELGSHYGFNVFDENGQLIQKVPNFTMD